MKYRFFKYLPLIFAVIAVKARGESKKQAVFSVYREFFGKKATAEQDNGRLPAFYFLGNYNSAQICRPQSQRVSNFFKNTFLATNKNGNYFRFLSNIYRHTRVGYVRSCKLILFPFHVFW